MAKITYPKTSPYSGTPQSNRYIGRYQHRKISPSSEDQLYLLEARHHNKPELLSDELYGTPEYWWVFMARNLNLIRDSIWDFKAGLIIVVPSLQHINSGG